MTSSCCWLFLTLFHFSKKTGTFNVVASPESHFRDSQAYRRDRTLIIVGAYIRKFIHVFAPFFVDKKTPSRSRRFRCLVVVDKFNRRAGPCCKRLLFLFLYIAKLTPATKEAKSADRNLACTSCISFFLAFEPQESSKAVPQFCMTFCERLLAVQSLLGYT